MPDPEDEKNGTARDKEHDILPDNGPQSRDRKIERKTGGKTSSTGKSRARSSFTRKQRTRAIIGLSNEERICTPQEIEALIYNKVELGLSNEQIHRVTGKSLATISKYTKGLTPKIINSDPTLNGSEVARPSEHAEPVSEVNKNNGETLPGRSYEVTAPRPTIVEEANGSQDASDEPRVVVRGPYMSNSVPDTLERIFSYSALTAGYTNVGDYVQQEILPDIKTLSIIKAAVPHTDRDSLERNFLNKMEDANAFQRMRERALGEARREIMEEKNNGDSS